MADSHFGGRLKVEKSSEVWQRGTEVLCGQAEVPAQLSNVLVEQVHTIVELQLVLPS
jgi:hypothetical protein